MATIRLPTDFKEFLKLLNSAHAEYLVVGGYAVAIHGHPRATGDLDVWVATTAENMDRVATVLQQFGYPSGSIAKALPLKRGGVLRMGVPPLRIELLTDISGVDFAPCYARRRMETIDGVEVGFIDLPDLLTNKRAAGRGKDVSDVDELG